MKQYMYIFHNIEAMPLPPMTAHFCDDQSTQEVQLIRMAHLAVGILTQEGGIPTATKVEVFEKSLFDWKLKLTYNPSHKFIVRRSANVEPFNGYL
jgi:hypothetical protein